MMMRTTSLLLAAASLAVPVQAWIQPLLHRPMRTASTTCSTRLGSTMPRRDPFHDPFHPNRNGNNNPRRSDPFGNPHNPDFYDIEAAREALEELVAHNALAGRSSSLSYSNPYSDSSSSFHVLTSSGRHRRQLEMDLLRQLHVVKGQELESQAVDELMHLWIYEHDQESAEQLEAMQETCSPGMFIEEEQLRIMCDRFPTWAEPRARLAILLFMKGVSDEAYHVALEALELKPWHFEVYPVLVMICLRYQDMGGALYWARRALPTYRVGRPSNNKRRKAWIEQALVAAAQQWERAEQETLKQQQQQVGTSGPVDDGLDSWQ